MTLVKSMVRQATIGMLVFISQLDVSASTYERPFILFNRDEGEKVLLSVFDSADPASAEPTDLMEMPGPQGWRVLGLFNGAMFFISPERELAMVDLQTGTRHQTVEPLPEHYSAHDNFIVNHPSSNEQSEIRVIDLNTRSWCSVVHPPKETEDGWQRRSYSADTLRVFQFNDYEANGDVAWVPCRVKDFRKPDQNPALFQVCVPRPQASWDFDGQNWLQNDVDQLTVNRRDPLRPNIDLKWLPGSRFACIATALRFAGKQYPAGGGESVWHLFVVDLEDNSVQARDLEALRGQGYELAAGFGHPTEMFGFAIDTMTLLGTGESQRIHPLSPHFSADTGASLNPNLFRQGNIPILHGHEPVRIGNERDAYQFELDESGERVLLRRQDNMRSRGICYDIYFGYFAGADHAGYYEWAGSAALRHSPTPPHEGWSSLDTLMTAAGAHPVNVDAITSSGRKDRSEYYTLKATAQSQVFNGKDRVLITFTLRYNGSEPAWTEPPWPMYPVLTGTLRGPAMTQQLSKIPFAVPNVRPEMALLEAGQTVEGYLALEDLPDGEYTLAAAYNGNPQSEWRGHVRAELLTFAVGDPVDSATARLEHVIQLILDEDDSMDAKPYLEELKRAGEAAIPLVIKALENIEAPSERDFRAPSPISRLYTFLEERSDPALLPFFITRTQSDIKSERQEGYTAIRKLYKSSEDAQFRKQIQDAIRVAYENRTPSERAAARKDFEQDFWPGFFDEMKVLAFEGDLVEQRSATDVLTGHYIQQFDTFSGEVAELLEKIAENQDFRGMDYAAIDGLRRFYERKVDRAEVERAIDQYRVRFPHILSGDDYFGRYNELWDIDWLLRAAEDPTEARLQLVLQSSKALSEHCGNGPGDAFPASWEALQSNTAARVAFQNTLKSWAACLKQSPPTFRVPMVKQ